MLDVLCLVLSFFVGNYIRHKSFIFSGIYNTLLLIIVLFQIVLYFLYEPFINVEKRGYLKEFIATIKFDSLSLLLVAIYLFVVKEGYLYSRLAIAYMYILYVVLSFSTRCIYKRISSKHDINRKKSLFIITDRLNLNDNINCLINSVDYNVTGICVLDANEINTDVKGIKIVATADNVLDYVCKNYIDEVFIGTDIQNIKKEVIDGITTAGITKHYVISNDYISGGKIEDLESYKVLSYSYRSFSSKDIFIKRIIDIIGGLVGFLITLVLVMIIGPIIKIKSPGAPIIYTSERIGKNGKKFRMYKFRSMIPNAEELKKELTDSNIVKDGMMFKIENDPRIIPGIGSFIRKTSIDEFPQFLNVLKGDMSLVGTRPPTPDEWKKYRPEHRIRLFIKPGVTGLWQISGRSSITDFGEVVKLDKEYIDNWDLSLDIKILFKTIVYVFSKKDDAM